MTDITITKQENRIWECMICKIGLTGVYYDITISYTRDGIETTLYKHICIPCLSTIHDAINKVDGCRIK